MSAPVPAPANEVDPVDATEQALIGAVFLNQEVFHAVSDVLDADCFGRPQHVEIWKIIDDLIKAGRVPRPGLIVQALPQDFKAAGLLRGIQRVHRQRGNDAGGARLRR